MAFGDPVHCDRAMNFIELRSVPSPDVQDFSWRAALPREESCDLRWVQQTHVTSCASPALLDLPAPPALRSLPALSALPALRTLPASPAPPILPACPAPSARICKRQPRSTMIWMRRRVMQLAQSSVPRPTPAPAMLWLRLRLPQRPAVFAIFCAALLLPAPSRSLAPLLLRSVGSIPWILTPFIQPRPLAAASAITVGGENLGPVHAIERD